MYAARRRQKSIQWKFQFGKFRIGQQFQLFDNTLGEESFLDDVKDLLEEILEE